MDFEDLRDEIVNDPKAIGLATTNSDQTNADRGNEIGRSNPVETIDVSSVAPEKAQAAVVGSEYAVLSAVARDAWGAIVGLPSIPVKDANIRAQIGEIWAAGTATRTNLLALQARLASRFEVVLGEGVRIRHQDIAQAFGRV